MEKRRPIRGASVAAKDSCVYVWASSTVHLSHDNGANWQTIQDPLFGQASHNTLVLFEDNVLVGGSTGVVKSSDRGLSWADFSDGLPKDADGNLYTVADLVRDNTYLYAVTSQSIAGIYRRPLAELPVSTRPAASAMPIKVFPNPVSGNKINLQLPENAPAGISVRLFDPTGRLLCTLALANGANTLDINGLAAGVYALQVLQGSGSSFEKIIVQH